MAILGRWGTGSTRSYYFRVDTDGKLTLVWTPNGTTASALSATSSVATGFSDGSINWIRVTLDVDNGASGRDVVFYTSNDGSTWTQLGTTITQSGVTSINGGSDSLYFGSVSNGQYPLKGTLYRAQVRAALNDKMVVDADFESQSAETYMFRARSDAGIRSNGLVLKGIFNHSSSVLDSSILDIAGDIDIQVKVALDDWTPSTEQYLLSKANLTTSIAYRFSVNTSGNLRLVTSANGTTLVDAVSTVITGISDGTMKWVRATRDVDNGASGNDTKFYTSNDGTTWTQLGSTVTNAGTTTIYNSSAGVEVGGLGIGTQGQSSGLYEKVKIYNGYDGAGSLVLDIDYLAPDDYAPFFVESSSNGFLVSQGNCEPLIYVAPSTKVVYSIPGNSGLSFTQAQMLANQDCYTSFYVSSKINLKEVFLSLNTTTAMAQNTVVHYAIYKADSSLQPTGAPICNFTTNHPIATSAVYVNQLSSTFLDPGNYLMAINASSNINVNYVNQPAGTPYFILTAGGTSSVTYFINYRTNAPFTSNPTKWNNILSASTRRFPFLLRWTV